MRKAISLGLVALALALGTPQRAEAQAAPTELLEVGALAPDFALPGATRYGLLEEPVRLSDYEGKTVVLAISNDPPEELRSWAYDADFPFLFASDLANEGRTYTAFGGGLRDDNMVDSRAVIVVGPDRRVAGVIPQFNQIDPTAYDELAEIIDRVTPEPDGED